MGGKTPSSSKVQAVLQSVWLVLICQDYQRQTRRIQQELGQQAIIINGVVLDNWEEGRPADGESRPKGYHPRSRVSECRAEKENMF